MVKKHCKDCRYGTYLFFRDWKWCESKDAQKAKSKTEREKCGYLKVEGKYVGERNAVPDYISKPAVHKTDFNERGDCPYYKRKWWKFWVK